MPRLGIQPRRGGAGAWSAGGGPLICAQIGGEGERQQDKSQGTGRPAVGRWSQGASAARRNPERTAAARSKGPTSSSYGSAWPQARGRASAMRRIAKRITDAPSPMVQYAGMPASMSMRVSAVVSPCRGGP